MYFEGIFLKYYKVPINSKKFFWFTKKNTSIHDLQVALNAENYDVEIVEKGVTYGLN